MEISVVIPLYNKSDYILRCIDSILSQSYSAKEIIVIDDGSTDGGAELVKHHFQSKVLLHSQKNLGVSKARNQGVALASSEYVAFLDADDYWQDDFLANIVKLNKSYPQAGLYCTGYSFLRDGEVKVAKNHHLPKHIGVIDDYFLACCNADLPITASSVCISKQLLLDINGFPESISLGEDQAVWGTLACITDFVFINSQSVIYDLSASGDKESIDLEFEVSPHVTIFESLIHSGKVPQRLVPSVYKLFHFSVMSCVKKNLLHNNKRKALNYLMNDKRLVWDIYRISALILVPFPKKFIAWCYSYARNFR